MAIEDTNEEGRLALEEPEMRLPWLESADEDLDGGLDDGLDWGRIGKFAGALVAVVLLFGLGVMGAREWWQQAPEGDGSLIEAPDRPYKVRPSDPGGISVAGTGDTAYEVGEGVDSEGVLAAPDPVPSPTPKPTKSATPTSAPSGVAVQVGAYSTEADARQGWETLRSRYAPLGSYDRRIVEGRADIGVVFRLQAIAPDTAGAFALCDDMRRNGIECQVKR